MTGPIKQIELPNGEKISVQDVDFEVVQETWNEYQLETGIKIRVKNVLIKAMLMLDEEGNVREDERGDPIVIISSSNVLTTKREEK
jgi:hypothetical protein